MPCTYTGSLEGDRALGAQKVIERQREELDRLARYLCAVCSHLEDNPLDTKMELYDAAAAKGIDANEIHDWWENHKLHDKVRYIPEGDPIEYKKYLELKEKYGGI